MCVVSTPSRVLTHSWAVTKEQLKGDEGTRGRQRDVKTIKQNLLLEIILDSSYLKLEKSEFERYRSRHLSNLLTPAPSGTPLTAHSCVTGRPLTASVS